MKCRLLFYRFLLNNRLVTAHHLLRHKQVFGFAHGMHIRRHKFQIQRGQNRAKHLQVAVFDTAKFGLRNSRKLAYTLLSYNRKTAQYCAFVVAGDFLLGVR